MSLPLISYKEFLARKFAASPVLGFQVDRAELNPALKPFTLDIAEWAIHGGRRAIFASFGLHKTATQLEIMRVIGRHEPSALRLIALPLGVIQEFKRDAGDWFQGDYAVKLKFIRGANEIDDERTIYLTNYETIREGKLDPRIFTAASLDEASVLRGFGGTKTFREFMKYFENGQVKYKFVATATPAPNEFIELLAYAAFLDIMDVGQAKTRFFKRNSEKADELTLHEHKKREFWLWMSTWAIFLQRPSDLGYSDEGYELPELDIHWHELQSNHEQAGFDPSGQGKLLKNAALGIQDAAREKRESLDERVGKLKELRSLDAQAHRLIWHDLEAERHAIEKSFRVKTVYGSQPLELRESLVIDFSNGMISELAGKPSMLGSGSNFQRHCHWAIYLGIGFKFNDFYQSLHRLQRYGQRHRVRVDLIYTEAEREVRRTLEQKWSQHKELMAEMAAIIREYGLATNALHTELARSTFKPEDRVEASGENWKMVNNDNIYEAQQTPSNCIPLILTSIPFSTQYEYTPSYNDYGHSESNEQFFEQMDYLTPELLRILKPGRVAAIHVKDRIVPGGITGRGYQTVYEFSDDVVRHFKKHGFGYLGRKTIVTDVVRENNQTYRLGWTEQCKDGSRMGVGMSEYLLLFRKDPSDTSNGYADEPVVKSKAQYSRSRWQIDAHGFMRSNGNRLLSGEDLRAVDHAAMFKLFRRHSLTSVYDFEHHVALGESLELCGYCNHIHLGTKDDDEGKVCGQVIGDGQTCSCTHYKSLLPKKFMLLQPQSWHPEVWTDITRMLSLNSLQSSQGRELHVCPLQFDIIDRVITQFTMPGETVLDPFAGIGSVPYRAIKLRRIGWGWELATNYYFDAAQYCKRAEAEASVPTLFDLIETQSNAGEEEMVAF